MLKSLTYSSIASAPLSAEQLYQLGSEAGQLNALDGITGLLLHDGKRFVQTVQGFDKAIDDLWKRLQRDPRHTDVRLVALRDIAAPDFPDWAMKSLLIGADHDLGVPPAMPTQGGTDLLASMIEELIRAA